MKKGDRGGGVDRSPHFAGLPNNRVGVINPLESRIRQHARIAISQLGGRVCPAVCLGRSGKT